MQDLDNKSPPGFALDRNINKEKLQNLLVGAVLAFLMSLVAVKFPALTERLNNAFADTQIGLLPKTALSPLPVIVEVDEQSLAAFGQWPWPRYRVAKLLQSIQQSGAVAIGIDAVFVEKDRTSPAEIQRMMEQDLQHVFPLAAIPETLWDYDKMLGRAIQSGPFVVSYFFSFQHSSNNVCLPKSASVAWLSATGKTKPDYLYQASAIACNVNAIQSSANNSGFINSAPDSDGLYRKTPLLIEYQGRVYPNLALQTFLTAHATAQFTLSENDSGLLLQANKLKIPLDKAGNLLIKFPTNGQHFKKVSAYDLLSGKIGQNGLNGKIVFVGVSATGLHEVRPTPYSPQFLGVEFHATIVDNLARQDFLQRPNQALSIELLISTILVLALFIGLAQSGLIASISVPCLLVILLIAASHWLLQSSGIVLSPALPVIFTLIAFLVLTVMKYIRAYRHSKEMALLVARTQEGIIGSFCSMSEYRDPETGAHIKRTQEYIKALAQHLKTHPKFKGVLTDESIDLLYKAAPLHDIGKIGIRDHILLKNDRLSDNEFEVMQSHPQIGADIISATATQIGWNAFMQIAYQICLYHQEKWDGSGYPQGLQGEAIPYPARFMALADVYDALISKRVYKPAFSHKKAVSLISEGRDKHFDPLLVDTFLTINGQFREIALRFLDDDEQKQTLLAE